MKTTHRTRAGSPRARNAETICADSFHPAFDGLIGEIVPALGEPH